MISVTPYLVVLALNLADAHDRMVATNMHEMSKDETGLLVTELLHAYFSGQLAESDAIRARVVQRATTPRKSA